MSEKFDQSKYASQYSKDHYYELRVVVPKDNNLKERIKERADHDGVSVSRWIIKAIEKELEWYE